MSKQPLHPDVIEFLDDQSLLEAYQETDGSPESAEASRLNAPRISGRGASAATRSADGAIMDGRGRSYALRVSEGRTLASIEAIPAPFAATQSCGPNSCDRSRNVSAPDVQ